MKFNKLSVKILLPLITVFMISFLGITIFVVRSQARFAREQLIKNAKITIQNILASTLDLFIEKQFYDIQIVLVNAKKANEDIEYIAIVDKHGKALAHTEVLFIDDMLTHTAFDRDALTLRAFTVREIPDTQEVFEVCTPMLAFGSEKEVLGILRIGINQRTIHKKIRQIRLHIIGFGVVAVLISIIIFTGIVDLFVNKPMKLLTKGAEQVSAGNLDITIPVRSQDEIGYFSGMFNQMAQHLKHSQKNYRTLVDNLNVGVYRNTPGPHGRFLRANPALAHIFGYDSTEEFMSKQVSDLYRNPDQRKTFIDVIEQHGSVHDMELAMQKKNGDPIWISVSANAAYDTQGKIEWIDGIVEDITEKKHAERALQESERKYRAIFEESKDMIFITTREGQVIDVSPACENLLGYTRQEGLQLNALTVYANPHDRTRFQEMMAQQGVVKDFEVTLRRKDGSEVETSMTATLRRAEDGTSLGYQGIIRDITAQKQAERERLHAMTLRQEKEAAEAANQVKTIFLANMTHELRTPLNGVLGYAHILECDSNLTDKQREATEIIHRNGEHLLMLIDDILDFSKIEANQLELQPAEFVLPRTLHQLTEITRIHAEQKRLSFQYEVPSDLPQVVYGDEKRLRQILLNLLGNAVKFTNQGGVMFRVAISPPPNLPHQGGGTKSSPPLVGGVRGRGPQHPVTRIRFETQDTGIGIAPEQLDMIFQPFWQPGTYRLHSEGTGLGLAISQRLAEKMGSQIYITSTVGQGTTCWFELELPVVAATVTDEPRQPQERSPAFPSQETLASTLNALPSEWLVTLKQSATAVDVELLYFVIEQIRERDVALADVLGRLVEDFEYDEVLRLIQEAEKEE